LFALGSLLGLELRLPDLEIALAIVLALFEHQALRFKSRLALLLAVFLARFPLLAVGVDGLLHAGFELLLALAGNLLGLELLLVGLQLLRELLALAGVLHLRRGDLRIRLRLR